MRSRSAKTDLEGLLAPDCGAGHYIRALQAGPFFVGETIHHSGLRLGTHRHEHACFHYVIRGAYAEATKGVSRIVPPRHALLKPAGLPHWNNFSHQACSLRIDFPSAVLSGGEARLPDKFLVMSEPQITRICSNIRAELDRNDDCSVLAIHGLCLELLAWCLRGSGLRSRRFKRPPECAVRCEDYLRARFRYRLRFDVIAAQCGVSRTHLATVFRAHHGCTMGDFVRRLRVEYVMQQLCSTAQPIAEIALAAGFSDQSHCTRVFRAQTGLPPIEWRSRRCS